MDYGEGSSLNLDDHLTNLKEFVEKLNNLEPSKQIHYIKKLTDQEIDYLSEIVLNFLSSKIKVNIANYQSLKKSKNILYHLASPKKSSKFKKKIFSTLKGLNILNILLPVAIQTLIRLT